LGYGYATEAATASLVFAFNELKLNEVYSFAAVGNKRSRAVMDRLKMSNTMIRFQHPMISEDSEIKEHVLYKIEKSSWQKEHKK